MVQKKRWLCKPPLVYSVRLKINYSVREARTNNRSFYLSEARLFRNVGNGKWVPAERKAVELIGGEASSCVMQAALNGCGEAGRIHFFEWRIGRKEKLVVGCGFQCLEEFLVGK